MITERERLTINACRICGKEPALSTFDSTLCKLCDPEWRKAQLPPRALGKSRPNPRTAWS